MRISHAEAIQLIEFQADHILRGDKQTFLNEHIATCAECQTYAQRLNQVENVLQSVMRKQWDRRPAPLSITGLIKNKLDRKSSNTILITRTALISLALMVFVMAGWQFTSTNTRSTSGTQFALLAIPTPSKQLTATNFSAVHCTQIRYQVQKNDSLDSIALKFATSKEKLITLNNLSSENIQLNVELLVPVCDTTPTSTVHPPTFTITPFLDPTTSTPG